jgi:chromosome segregation ATPase
MAQQLLDKVAGDIDELREEHRVELEEAKEARDKYLSEISDLMVLVTEQNQENRELQNQRAEREHELMEERHSAKARIAFFEREMAHAREDELQAKRELEAAISRLQELEEAVVSLRSELASKDEDLESFERETRTLKNEVNDLLVIRTDLSEELKVYRERGRDDDDVQGLVGGLDDDASVGQLREALEELQSQLKASSRPLTAPPPPSSGYSSSSSSSTSAAAPRAWLCPVLKCVASVS